MENNRKKPPALPIQGRQPSNKNAETSRMTVEWSEKELEAALSTGDGVRALEIIDSAPRGMRRQPEFMLINATVLLMLGDDQQAFQLLRDIERKHPRFMPLYLTLALFYMDREWPAHALQAAKRAQSDRDLNDEGRATLAQIIEEATASIQYDATKLDLPFEAMQRAIVLNERAQMAMDENRLSEVDHFCREAIKIAPNWNPPHNNRAQVLYFSGKVEEAISVSEAVLAREVENIFALSSLVTYHIGVNQPEQARNYANRLGKLVDKFPKDSMEIENTITAFALVEDTPSLWKIAKSYLDAPSDSLFGRSWFCLAVAAIRNGKWKDALKLLQKIDEEELPPTGRSLLHELEITMSKRQPRLAWMPPAYPGVDLFLRTNVMAELEFLLQKISGPLSPSQKRKFDGFFQKYPFMVTVMKRMLLDEASNQMALEILSEMNRPDADAEILGFASSQIGTREARVRALMSLMRNGRYTGPKTIKLWDEEIEEWRDIELNTQRIDDIEPNARPDTMLLIERAQKAKDPGEAISLLQKAVEKEPTSPIAVFNLGVMLAQNGKEEEGEKLLHHSVEVDPNYTYGHASIALSEANKGNEQKALDHLGIVTRAEIIAPDTAVIANLAWFLLALDKRDLKTARQHLETAAQINPDHRLLNNYEEMLKKAEQLEDTFGFIFEYQRKRSHRAHQKLLKTPLTEDMDLRACLETYTKDMLVGLAHFLRTSSSGKKGELASWLAELLLDPERLQRTLKEELTEKEREALRWMLEVNGVRPWEEFVSIYGDDVGESTSWNYHQPDSIPGRLRVSGLFYSGILGGQTVAFIPADVRLLLQKLL